MSKVLLISPEKCLGCRTCELICSYTKNKKFNPRNSAVAVIMFEEAAISVPMMCMHCEDAACVRVCSTNALVRNKDGAVLLEKEKCIGCKLCVSACPFGNISLNTQTRETVKCDMCSGDPQCASWCPTGAIEYKEADSINMAKKKNIADKFKEVFGEVS